MHLQNTPTTYGTVAKTFHWLIALLMLSQIALGVLGVLGAWLGTGAWLDRKVQVLEIHKLLGLAIFALALARILWTLGQPKPQPVHPDRPAEIFAAEVTHFALYGALVLMPLSGWIGHAASSGFAPIPWPFGQSLPLVPKSAAVSAAAFAVHWLFAWILAAAIAAHVAGALKHALIDRDGTLRRMWFGRTAAGRRGGAHRATGVAFSLALLIYAIGGAGVLALTAPEQSQRTTAPASTGEWVVEDGSLGLAVTQFGERITGDFADWSADITFDEAPTGGTYGDVTVTVALDSLSLGSVTENALAPDYMDAGSYPEAVFTGPITAQGEGYVVDGTLDLSGQTVQVRLPFTLDLEGDTATMSGEAVMDRRDFGIGGEGTGTLGAEVTVPVTLTATRAADQ